MESVSYDQLWQTTWGDLQQHGPVHRHLLRQLIRIVWPLSVRTVLDVGCGSGEHLSALAALGKYDLTGMDVSPVALELAKRKVPSARLVQLDIERDHLSEQFDLVMSLQVVEHLMDDVAALRHMAHMTRSYALISTLLGRMRPSERAIGHVRNYSTDELRRKLKSAGLEVLTITGWGFPLYSPIYRSLTEHLPGGPPTGPMGPLSRLAAWMLYYLYWLNWPGRGDVVSVLARPMA